MYKLTMDTKYYIVVRNMETSNGHNLFIYDRLEKYKDHITYDLSYRIREVSGYYCPYIPLTFNAISPVPDPTTKHIENQIKLHISDITYTSSDIINEINYDRNYRLIANINDKKIYAQIKILL